MALGHPVAGTYNKLKWRARRGEDLKGWVFFTVRNGQIPLSNFVARKRLGFVAEHSRYLNYAVLSVCDLSAGCTGHCGLCIIEVGNYRALATAAQKL